MKPIVPPDPILKLRSISMGNIKIANRLKYWREQRGLSQRQLANKVKPPVSISTIRKHEGGLRGLTEDMIERYSEALDIEPYQLFMEI